MSVRRGRPPKDPLDRKDYDLRIPVTTWDRDFLRDTADILGLDFAAWARQTLLNEANRLCREWDSEVSPQPPTDNAR